jgi:hypothetical protein
MNARPNAAATTVDPHVAGRPVVSALPTEHHFSRFCRHNA